MMTEVRAYNAADLVAAVTVKWRQYCGEPVARKPAPVWAYSEREVRRMRMPEPRRIVYTPPGCKVTRLRIPASRGPRPAAAFDRLASRARRLEAA